MKKSMKKACAFALLATSAAALAGTNAVVFVNNPNQDNNAVYAANNSISGLKVFTIDGNTSVAYVGSKYTIPTASFSGETNGVTATVTGPLGQAVEVKDNKFEVGGIGTYTITYSYKDSTLKEYKANYTVEAQVSKNAIVLSENTNRILPKYVYQSFDKGIYVPTATVEFEGEELNYEVEITVTAPNPGANPEDLTVDADGKIVGYTELKEGTYSVRYDARTVATQDEPSIFLNTKTVEFVVLTDEEFKKEYSKGKENVGDYELKFDYSKTAPTSAEIGKPQDLPTPVGQMGSEKTPVYYDIEAYLFVDGREIDVTEQTIENDYVFTAKKSYEIDGTTYNADNASYQFYYNVTDALGKKAEKSGFMISGVKDSIEPEIVIADPYNAENPGEVQDVSYKLQSNFVNGENIVIKAIYAKDLADDYKNLTLSRYLRKDSQSSVEEAIYDDSKSDDKTAYAKDIVFNATRDLTDNEIDGGELEPGTYTIYYKAVDSSNKTKLVPYTFTVSTTFAFDVKPEVNFVDEFLTTVNHNDVVKFSKPEALSSQDDRLNTYVMYRFDQGEWTRLTNDNIGEDGKYFVEVNKDGASTLTLRAVTESDATETYDVEADDVSQYDGYRYAFDEVTLNIVDNQDKYPVNIESIGTLEASYKQNTEIVLPELSLTDELVDFVTVDIHVTHESGQEIDVENGVVFKTFEADEKAGTYDLSGAKFYATLDGNYEIVYEVSDAGNHKTYIFLSTEVTPNKIVSEPVFGKLPEALNDGKLELGKTITLPVPGNPDETQYGYSVNVKGPVGSVLTRETFTPKKAGTYTLVYELYQKSDKKVVDTKEFKVEVTDTTAPEVRVEWNLKDAYKAGNDMKVLIPIFSASDISGIDLNESKITVRSKSFDRTIWGYEIDEALAKYQEYLQDNTKDGGKLLVPLKFNEEYKVTYTVYDKSNSKNSTTESYTIKVGDLVAPIVTVADDILQSTYKVDTKNPVTIDMSKIDFIDNETEKEDIKFSITVKNNTTSKTLDDVYEDEDKYGYIIETAGEYTVTFKAIDKVGNEKTVTRTFTVNEDSNKGLETNEVIAVAACCVAVLILAGAVVYMVITKKKIQSYK